MTDQRGFTLVELLVAMLILGLIASSAALALSGVMKNRDLIAGEREELSDLAVARALIRADLAQIALRPTRDADGAFRPFLFDGQAGANGDGPLLAFARAGWSNPGAQDEHGGLVYVEYRMAGGDLMRRVHRMPDGGEDSARDERLIAGAGAVVMRYFDGGGWRESWQAVAGRPGLLPRAVSIAFPVGDEVVEYLFLTGEAS